MLFNSLPFLYVFLPAAYFVFWKLRTKSARYIWLAVTGYMFYSFWNYKFCGLLLFSTVVSYLAGLGFLRWTDARRRTLCLVLPIVSDLAILAFFKYTNFGLDTLARLGRWTGHPFQPGLLHVVLPVGISFYTFHNISYIVDSYRGVVKPTRNFWEYACYVSLFSQLVAGPIIRFRQIEADLDRIDMTDRTRYVNEGWSFFTLGMVQKVLIADTIAAIINPALAHYTELSTVGTWLCMLGYSYQLYFDFAGYSHMAVGLGFLFGLRIPQNFNSPYKALNITDFWRRWHISLTSCLRDYIYIPLGGNRVSRWKVNRNILITLLLGGLWHGANWTFVCWGLYHGVLLVAYHVWGEYWDRWSATVRRIGTFLLVLIGWVLFRSESFGMAATILKKMLFFESGRLLAGAGTLVACVAVAGFVAHWSRNTFELQHRWHAPQAAALASLFLLCLLKITGAQPSPFLYFQF